MPSCLRNSKSEPLRIFAKQHRPESVRNTTLTVTLIPMVLLVRRWLTRVGLSTAHPAAFVIVGSYIALWLVFSPQTFGWAGVATIATWIMTLFIRRAENRDTLALQAKLDELLRAEHRARNELTTLDQKEPEEIARHRARQRRG